MKITNFNPVTGQPFTAANAQEIKTVVNANADALDEKANTTDLLASGKIKTELLPGIYFEGLEGSGTIQDPYRFTGYTGPLPTPTPTPTVTITPSVSATPGVTPTPTSTPNVTPTPSSSGSVVNLGLPVTAITYMNGAEKVGTNDYHLTETPTQGGNVAIGMALNQGVSGWMSMKYTGFAESGEASTANLAFGIGLDPFYGGSDALINVYGKANGSLIGSFNLGTAFTENNKIILNSIIRGRFDASNGYIEYSNDGGATYTVLRTFTRPAGLIRVKIGFSGDQRFARDVRHSGFTTV